MRLSRHKKIAAWVHWLWKRPDRAVRHDSQEDVFDCHHLCRKKKVLAGLPRNRTVFGFLSCISSLALHLMLGWSCSLHLSLSAGPFHSFNPLHTMSLITLSSYVWKACGNLFFYYYYKRESMSLDKISSTAAVGYFLNEWEAVYFLKVLGTILRCLICHLL